MTVKDLGRVDTWVKKVTCKNCSHELEYVEGDVLTYQAGDYSGDTWQQKYIPCPVCSTEDKHHKVLIKQQD